MMPTAIDRNEVGRLVREENAQLVEVLPDSDYQALHLPGAINIPLEDLNGPSTEGLDRGRPIIVYCYDYQ